jgi:hypothetical protein
VAVWQPIEGTIVNETRVTLRKGLLAGSIGIVTAVILCVVCVALMNNIASAAQKVFAKADRYPARSEALFNLQHQAQKLPGVERANQYDIGPSEAFTGKQIFAYVDFSAGVSYAQVAASIDQIEVDPDRAPSNARIYVIARFDGNEIGLADNSALNRSRLDFVTEVQEQPGMKSVTVKRLQSDDNALIDASNEGLFIEARIDSDAFDRPLLEQTIESSFTDSTVNIVR